MRKIIEETKIDIKDTGNENVKYINITTSIGVCEFDDTMDADTFIQKADKALYEAKENGRNRVIIAE